jgi:hypothetical protein
MDSIPWFVNGASMGHYYGSSLRFVRNDDLVGFLKVTTFTMEVFVLDLS